MSLRIVTLLLLATLAVVGSFCVVVLDERQQAFRTLLNDPEPKLFDYSLNTAVLDKPGWYFRIPGLPVAFRPGSRFHSPRKKVMP